MIVLPGSLFLNLNLIVWFVSGPFVSALEYATGTVADVVGKPEGKFFLSALNDLQCDPANTVMIGDVSDVSQH